MSPGEQTQIVFFIYLEKNLRGFTLGPTAAICQDPQVYKSRLPLSTMSPFAP